MSYFDPIIGYTAVKRELERIADVLAGHEAYNILGVKTPRGLLLHGEPGLGKTLMATCLIRASGRKAFVCRRGLPDGEFIHVLKETFESAKEEAPSIVFLDDMDKFANGDSVRKDAEEYVTVQSCIDNVKNCDVFVLATANSLQNMPRSLMRSGRFDRIIEIEAPEGEDAVSIIRHYMAQKNCSTSMDITLLARLLEGNSCADLEAVINEAGIYAGFERSAEITTEHFLKACMRLIFHVPSDALEQEDSSSGGKRMQVAYHEAGHAVIREVLSPGSVTMMALYKTGGHYGGFTAFYSGGEEDSILSGKTSVICSLGGMAAVEQVFGVQDGGARRDLTRAFRIVGDMVRNLGLAGLHLCGRGDCSQELMYQQETAIASEVERYYRKAKEILSRHSGFLHQLAAALSANEILTMYDVERIRMDCEMNVSATASA